MTRQDQLNALIDILDKLLDWDTKKFQLAPETSPDIRRFLRGRPGAKQLNRAMLDVYTAVKAQQRRQAGRRAGRQTEETSPDRDTDP